MKRIQCKFRNYGDSVLDEGYLNLDHIIWWKQCAGGVETEVKLINDRSVFLLMTAKEFDTLLTKAQY